MHSVEPVGLDGLPPNLTEKSSPPNLRHDSRTGYRRVRRSLSHGDIRLPGHQVQRLAAQQSRDDRDLALNGKALRTIPVGARRGTYASFGGASGRARAACIACYDTSGAPDRSMLTTKTAAAGLCPINFAPIQRGRSSSLSHAG